MTCLLAYILRKEWKSLCGFHFFSAAPQEACDLQFEMQSASGRNQLRETAEVCLLSWSLLSSEAPSCSSLTSTVVQTQPEPIV